MTDMHWGSEGNSGYVSTRSELKSKLDELISDANTYANQGYDTHIVWGGDNVNESGNKTDSQQRVTDFTDYVESNTNNAVSHHYVIGNHEEYNQSTWGEWAYSGYGFSSVSDTYYVPFDHHHAKGLVLNTGYSGDDTLMSGVPSGQYDWLETELETTDKPVLVWTHTPITRGKWDNYDDIGGRARAKYGELLSRHDNVVAVFYGHSHHDQQGSANDHTTFHRSLRQEYQGAPYIYQHYPHRLGTEEDETYTPYAKVHVRQDGHVDIEQSYAGDGTGYREQFSHTGGGGGNPQSAQDYIETLRLDVEDTQPSLDKFEVTENGGAIAIEPGGSSSSYLMRTNSSDGNSCKMVLWKDHPMYHQRGDAIHFPDIVMDLAIRADVLSNQDAGILHGNPNGHRVGFDIGGGEFRVITGNDSASSTTTISTANSIDAAYRLYYSRRDRQCNVVKLGGGKSDQWRIGVGGDHPSYSTTSGNDFRRILHAYNATGDSTSKDVRINYWRVIKGARLPMVR